MRPTMRTEHPWARPLRYLDVVVVFVGAPIVLVAGVSLAGYAIGGAAWLLLRALGLAVDRRASDMGHVVEQVALRLGYRLARAALLTGAAVLALKAGGRDDGLTALAVIVVAFTARLPVSRLEARGS